MLSFAGLCRSAAAAAAGDDATVKPEVAAMRLFDSTVEAAIVRMRERCAAAPLSISKAFQRN